MRTQEIKTVLNQLLANSLIKTWSVVAKDEFVSPPRRKMPAAFVVNIQDSQSIGCHWTAIYYDQNKKCYFFDSAGRSPLENGFRLQADEINPKQLQSINSDVCGQFAIVFLHRLSQGKTFHEALKIFTSNTKKNDQIARAYVKKVLRKGSRNRKTHYSQFL